MSRVEGTQNQAAKRKWKRLFSHKRERATLMKWIVFAVILVFQVCLFSLTVYKITNSEQSKNIRYAEIAIATLVLFGFITATTYKVVTQSLVNAVNNANAEGETGELDNGSQSARTIAIRSAAAELEQIANNFEIWAKKERAKFVAAAFNLAEVEDWVNTYLLKQRLVAVFFSHPHLSYDKNSGLTPFLTTEEKEFHLIIDTFRIHMPSIATSLKELYDEFWEDVEYRIKCYNRSKKVREGEQQGDISPSTLIGERAENVSPELQPILFLDGAVVSTVKRLRHIAKIAKGNLATSGPAETEQGNKNIKKQDIPTKNKEKWYQNRTIQAAIISAFTLILVSCVGWYIFSNSGETTNIFADVSKDGTILRSKDFHWKISKSKDKEDNVVYLINGIEGNSTAISVFPDNSTKKYFVRNAYDGIVIVFTCPEEEVPNFTIKVKY